MGTATEQLTAKDFATDQEVRWCPGCGDYAILKCVQRTLPQLGARTENTVFVSGIPPDPLFRSRAPPRRRRRPGPGPLPPAGTGQRLLLQLPAFRAEDRDPHLGRALGLESQQARGLARHVDDAAAHERPAVVDPHHHRTPVLQVDEIGRASCRERV